LADLAGVTFPVVKAKLKLDGVQKKCSGINSDWAYVSYALGA